MANSRAGWLRVSFFHRAIAAGAAADAFPSPSRPRRAFIDHDDQAYSSSHAACGRGKARGSRGARWPGLEVR